jgi:hypothetical protein
MIKELKKSFKEVFTTPLLLPLVIIDASFFFMWGLILTPLSNSLSAHALLFMGRQTTFLTLVALIALYFISAFLVYVCFHGPAWWLAKRIAKKKQSLRKYFFAFLKVNILWAALIIIIKLVDLFANLRQVALEGTSTPSIITTVLFWLVLLLAFLSYSKPNIKSIFIPVKKSVPLLLTSLILFELVRWIPTPLYGINAMLGNIVGFILVFPMLALIRVCAIHIIDNDNS